jgi:hypothetical protein
MQMKILLLNIFRKNKEGHVATDIYMNAPIICVK